MKSYVVLPNIKRRIIPEKFRLNDNRFPEGLVEYFLKEFTKKGDKILDIFAGLGTTFFVAEELGRIPFGIEIDKERYQYILENIKHKKNIVNGDTRKLLEYNLPRCNFCFSSPTFIHVNEQENPLSDFKTLGGYKQYLEDIRNIYSDLKEIMMPNSLIIIDIANLKRNGDVTTLAWDVAKEVSKVIHFKGEIIIIWEYRESKTVDGQSESWRIEGAFGYGYDHSYCLVYQNK